MLWASNVSTTPTGRLLGAEKEGNVDVVPYCSGLLAVASVPKLNAGGLDVGSANDVAGLENDVPNENGDDAAGWAAAPDTASTRSVRDGQ